MRIVDRFYGGSGWCCRGLIVLPTILVLLLVVPVAVHDDLQGDELAVATIPRGRVESAVPPRAPGGRWPNQADAEGCHAVTSVTRANEVTAS